ncbi:MAG: ATP-binding protein [Ureaplasma sp.]|nr:ATP-binding protein [Ureaplasma sp.]
MEKILETEIWQKSTYQTFWDKKEKIGLNLNTCLSELIDNSISSFIQNRSCDDNVLNINIKSIYNYDGKRQIIVIDNAFGMNKEELKNAMVVSKDVEIKENSSFNQYGIGLKDSIFWIGDDAKIITKKHNHTYKLTFNPIDKNLRKGSDYFLYDINEIDNDPDIELHGTKIIIDCWKGKNTRYFSKKELNIFKEVDEFLGKKYKNYINGIDGWKLSLRLNYIDRQNNKNGYTHHEITAKNFNSSPLTINTYCPKNKNLDDYINDIKNKIDINNDNPIFNTLLNKFLNKEEIKWTDTILLKKNYDDNSTVGKKMKIYFSLLDSASKEKSGLIISHRKRYIHFPSKEEDKVHGTFSYLKNPRQFQSHDSWLVMELAIEDIEGNENCEYIRPDHNKVKLIFEYDDNEYSERNFKNSISEYFEKNIDEFIKFIITLKNDYWKSQSTEENAKKYYKNGNPESVANTTTTFDQKKGSINFDGENGYKFEVKIIEDETNEQIFICDNLDNEEEKTKYIQINKGSKYIKKDDILSIELLLLYSFLKIKKDDLNQNWIGNENNINNLILKIEKWKK